MADILQAPFTMQLLKWKLHTQIEISLTFVQEVPIVKKSGFVEAIALSLIDNKSSLVYVMWWFGTISRQINIWTTDDSDQNVCMRQLASVYQVVDWTSTNECMKRSKWCIKFRIWIEDIKFV